MTAGDGPETALVRSCFEALSAGDFAELERVLAPDAVWLSVPQLEGRCDGRKMIVEVMRRNAGGRIRGSITELEQHGPRLIVGFRPDDGRQPADRPLDHGVAYVVVTVIDGLITEIKGCVDRADAVAKADDVAAA